VVRARVFVAAVPALAIFVLGISGCSSDSPSSDTTSGKIAGSPQGVDKPPTGPGPASEGDAALPTNGPSVKDAKSQYDKVQGAFHKNPADTAAKAAFIKAATALADANMVDQTLPSKVKYPDALKYYREVLAADPANKHAKACADEIVEIYKGLGKPVPGGG
jgi:hypothetical protein